MKIFYLLPGYLGIMGILFLIVPRQMVAFDNLIKRKFFKFLKDQFSDNSKVKIIKYVGIGLVLFALVLVFELRKL